MLARLSAQRRTGSCCFEFGVGSLREVSALARREKRVCECRSRRGCIGTRRECDSSFREVRLRLQSPSKPKLRRVARGSGSSSRFQNQFEVQLSSREKSKVPQAVPSSVACGEGSRSRRGEECSKRWRGDDARRSVHSSRLLLSEKEYEARRCRSWWKGS